MTPETHRLIQRLAGCTFAPATSEKRFVRQMAAKKPEDTLTEKQLMFLGAVHYRYRKQLAVQGFYTEEEERKHGR